MMQNESPARTLDSAYEYVFYKPCFEMTDVVNSNTQVLMKGIPSLDGIRACSIVIVVASHCGLGNLIPGGLGVTIFFFLSGYLITTLLDREYRLTRNINVRHFYIRRALRLYPPLIMTLVIAYSLVSLGALGGSISVSGALAQIFYFANYYQIFFDSGHSIPNGTGILWSLAVEEHFYLIYPLFLFLCIRFCKTSTLITILTGLCAAALFWRMHLVSAPGFEIARTYYASDTRFDSILYGCIYSIASVRPDQRLVDRGITRKHWIIFALGLVGIIISIVYRNPFFRETSRYTLQGISLMPIFYLSINGKKTILFRVLNSSFVRRIGIYSYSIYLIHFILLDLITRLSTHAKVDTLGPITLFFLVMCGASLYAFFVDSFIDPYFRRLRIAFH